MSDYIDRVEIGVDIVVTKESQNAAAKVKQELEKVNKAGEAAGSGAGDKAPDAPIRKSGEAAKQATPSIQQWGSELRRAGDSLRDAIGDNALSDLADYAAGWAEYGGNVLDKVKSLGSAVYELGRRRIGGALGASLARLGIMLMNAGPAALNLGRALASLAAGPVGVVAAAVGALGYAWYSAGQQSKQAIAEMEEADKKLKALVPKQIKQTDAYMASQNDIRTTGTKGATDLAGIIAGAEGLGDSRFAQAAEVLEEALGRIKERQDEINSTLTQEERVIGSVAARLQEQINLKQNELEIARAQVAVAQEKVNAAGEALRLTREEVNVAQAGLDVLQRQADARLSTAEKLARLSPGQRNAGLRAFEEFRTTGDVNAGKRAEQILGFQINSVGKALAKTIDVGNDVLDELGQKLNERDQELIALAEKAAGGQGIDAIKSYLDALKTKEAEQVATLEKAKAELKRATEKYNELQINLVKEITRLTQELKDVQQAAGIGAPGD